MLCGLSKNGFRFVIEKVVAIKDDKKNIQWGEILCKEDIGNLSLDDWELWYHDLAHMIPHLLAKTNFNFVTFNLDSHQILNKNIIYCIEKINEFRDSVGIEWTETLKPVNSGEWRQIESTLNFLQYNGYSIIFDDIGTGECLLKKSTLITPDAVKIDGPTFQRSLQNGLSFHIFYELLQILRRMNIASVIEWVGDLYVYHHASRMKADFMQGFLWNNTRNVYSFMNKTKGEIMEYVELSKREMEREVENGTGFYLTKEEAEELGFPIFSFQEDGQKPPEEKIN